jgi:hypothetical protein
MLSSAVGTLDEKSKLLLGFRSGEHRRPEVVAAAQVDHRRPVIPRRQHVVCCGAAGLQIDVFDEVNGAVDSLHRRRLVRFDPLRDGDVADVCAEEEEVRGIGELDVIVPEIVEQFCRFGAALGKQVGGFVVLPVL